MSRAEVAPVIPLRAPPSSEDELARVRRAVDLPRLIAAGYDPGGQVFRPPPEHPVFGYELCPVAECGAAREWDVVCRAYLIARIRETLERAELQALLSAERVNRSAILERLPARHELNVLNVGASFDGAAG